MEAYADPITYPSVKTRPVGLCGVLIRMALVLLEKAALRSLLEKEKSGGRRTTGFTIAPAMAMAAL